LSRLHLLSNRKIPEDEPVESEDIVNTEQSRAPCEESLCDRRAGLNDVIDLAPQILLRWRELELSLEATKDFLFGQGVPLNGSSSKNPFSQVELVQL
jgi:hypothetical protein